jgi:hypothetical protein
MATRRANAGEPILRLRPCVLCHALFVICRSCDHGQRYCQGWCRFWAWREHRRQANRRHQRSPEGRADHRDRQRAYRKRCAQRRWTVLTGTAGKSAVTESLSPSPRETVTPKSVTDTTSLTLTSADMMAARNSGSATAAPLSCSAAKVGQRLRPRQKPDGKLEFGWLRCIVCGRCGRFVDPFPPRQLCVPQKEV